MTDLFPTADDYAAEHARHASLEIVDLQTQQSRVTDAYSNQVMLDINDACMRLAVFEGEYRWHFHPDTDELFLVVSGELQIDFATGATVSLREWQSVVVPKGTVHRTRGIGRTVNVTVEKQGAKAVFVDGPSSDA